MSLTIPYSTRSVAYTAAAGQIAFPVPFPVLSAGDLTVTLIRGGGRSVLALSTAYIVTGVGAQTGAQAVLTAGSIAGDTILIEGSLTPQRQTDIQSNGPIPADALNTDANALAIMVQELRRDVNRSLRRSGEDPNGAANNLLPDGATSSVLAVDTGGNVVAIPLSSLGSGSGGGAGITLPVPVSEGGTGAADPATARSDLGLGSVATLNAIDNTHLGTAAVQSQNMAPGAVTPQAFAVGSVTLVAESATLTVPPSQPQQNMLWIVPVAASGAWTGQQYNVAVANGSGGWTFYPPGVRLARDVAR